MALVQVLLLALIYVAVSPMELVYDVVAVLVAVVLGLLVTREKPW
jgi:hypothetical protein